MTLRLEFAVALAVACLVVGAVVVAAIRYSEGAPVCAETSEQ